MTMHYPRVVALLLALLPFVASAQVTVEATILGANGRPMPMAHAHVRQHEWERLPMSSVRADEHGRVLFAIPANGLYHVQFTGVGHHPQQVALATDDQGRVRVNVRLAARGFAERPDSVLIIGDFNGFDPATARLMTRNPDGTFSAEFRTTAPLFRFQITNARPGTDGPGVAGFSGTQADEYEYDGAGYYRSVVKVTNGIARITFDPSKVFRSEAEPSIEFAAARVMREMLRASLVVGHWSFVNGQQSTVNVDQ